MLSGYHVLNFIAIDLQLYKIFTITRVSFLAHSVQKSSRPSLKKQAFAFNGATSKVLPVKFIPAISVNITE